MHQTPDTGKIVWYRWIDHVERLEMYRTGGYHPVMIDDELNNRYRVVDKLGWGGYSVVWLAHDTWNQRFVALKVCTANGEVARREPRILRDLSTHAHQDLIPAVLDEFVLHGPNGQHVCYSLPPAQGDLGEASFSRLFSLEVARILAARLCIAVRHVHSKGYVHGDIHLRNALSTLPSSLDHMTISAFREKYGEPETEQVRRRDGQPLTENVPAKAVIPLNLGKRADQYTTTDAAGLMLSDFGEAFRPSNEQRLGRDCHVPLLKRAPETFFEPDEPLSFGSDIWSLGVAIWDLVAMKTLFAEMEPPDEIVAEQIEVLGADGFPKEWQEKFDSPVVLGVGEGQAFPRRPGGEREVWPTLEEAFESSVQNYRKDEKNIGLIGVEEKEAILRLLRRMLVFKPNERISASEVLASEWMVKWALPELQRAQHG
ncbi:protein kinase [Elsinoe ampelina]|uniref:Protein kinase n=1 Tax=Elsinoe ampelina TaxID=302913 RepID=A0A6A6GNM7_9PEZI|nr:protein kinase [Elsinoe ampelina]